MSAEGLRGEALARVVESLRPYVERAGGNVLRGPETLRDAYVDAAAELLADMTVAIPGLPPLERVVVRAREARVRP